MFWTSLTRKTTTGATRATHAGPGIAPHGERPRTHFVRALAEALAESIEI